MSKEYYQTLTVAQLMAVPRTTLDMYWGFLTDHQRTQVLLAREAAANVGNPEGEALEQAGRLERIFGQFEGIASGNKFLSQLGMNALKEGDKNELAASYGVEYPYRVGTEGDANSGSLAWQECQKARAFIASNLQFYRDFGSSSNKSAPWPALRHNYRRLCVGMDDDGTSSATSVAWVDEDFLRIGWDKQAGYFGAVENLAIPPDDPSIENPNQASIDRYRHNAADRPLNPYASVSPPGSANARGNTLRPITGYKAIVDEKDTFLGQFLTKYLWIAAGVAVVGIGIYYWKFRK